MDKIVSETAKPPFILHLRVSPSLVFHYSIVKHHLVKEIPGLVFQEGEEMGNDVPEMHSSLSHCVNHDILNVKKAYRAEPGLRESLFRKRSV